MQSPPQALLKYTESMQCIMETRGTTVALLSVVEFLAALEQCMQKM
jgi:hypothetical protein